MPLHNKAGTEPGLEVKGGAVLLLAICSDFGFQLYYLVGKGFLLLLLFLCVCRVWLFFFFFFFFLRKKTIYSINHQQKLLSINTKLEASLWMSSTHIRGTWDSLANLANLLATLFPFRFTCENVTAWKLDTRCRESSIRWPKEAKQSSSELR